MKIKIHNRFYYTCVLAFLLIFTQNAFSHESDTLRSDTLKKKSFKNTVKINLTNPMFFGSNNYILGYERTIGQHQSFTLNVGTFSLGRIKSFNTDSIKWLDKNITSLGLSLSGDYRFYLAKQNKFNSPHGVYIGPYFAINRFTRNFSFSNISVDPPSELTVDWTFRVATVGFQLGYQFVFWDRLSLDMVLFGPGFSFYKIEANVSTNLNKEREEELFKKINEKLAEKIPGYSIAIQPGEFEKTGSANTTSLGYRYIMMLGFRF
jgi:hypothetical protein